ncbi:MAG: M20/M25/M40 family metallo-hydrolase [Nanoarchaeota archaeon]|nr:M20/M25/M40 family metallo-hydrolase [Nanoarchaeota archaeon]
MKEQIIELAKKLILFKSTVDNPEEKQNIIDFVIEYLKNYDVKTEKLEFEGVPSLVVTFDGEKKQKVWMNGHIDVVPADDDMYEAFEKDGRLYGRGALDMKTNAAASIMLMVEFSKMEKKPSVGLMLVTDEEIGGFNGSKKLMEAGYTGDFLICCEPTSLDVKNKAKGIFGVELVAKGKSAHGAYPWDGENAIYNFYPEFEKVKKMFTDPMTLNVDVWDTTYSLNRLNSGTANNKVPDECKGYVDIRYTDKFDKEQFIEKVKAETKFEVKVVMDAPMFFTDQSNPMFMKFIEIARKHNPELKIKHGNGASDTRFFSEAGLAATEFGGTGEGMHSENEYIEINSVLKSYEVWKEFILSS